MSTRNYVTCIGSKTFSDQEKTRLMALAAGIERCEVKGIGDLVADMGGALPSRDKRQERVDAIYRKIVTDGWMPPSISQRQLDPTTDLVVATALEDWLTAALAVVGTYYTCFQAVVGPQLTVGRLMVMYGVTLNGQTLAGPPINVNKLRFRKAGAAGNIIAEFDLQEMLARQETTALFSEPIVIDPNDIFAVQARCFNVTNVAEQVYIHNYLFEVPTRIV